MAIKVIMPVMCKDKIESLKAHVRASPIFSEKKRKPKIIVISAYSKSVPPENLNRQTIVFIVNSTPKLITKNDIAFIMSVNNPILMAMLSARVTQRVNKIFPKKLRQWYLLEYDPKAKGFIEYYLP